MRKLIFSIFLLLSVVSFSNFISSGGSMYCLKIGNVTDLINSGDHVFKAGLCRITTNSDEKVIRNVTVTQKGGHLNTDIDFTLQLAYGISFNYLKYNSKTNHIQAYVYDPFNPNVKAFTFNFLVPVQNIVDYTDVLSYGFDYDTFMSDCYSVY